MGVKSVAISVLNAKDKEAVIKKISEAREKLSSNKLNNGFDILVHLDIMDGKFVSQHGIDLELIKSVKENNLYADVHLMVEGPLKSGFIDRAISLGADAITVHYEAEGFKEALEYLSKADVKVGVAIKPDTDVEVLKKYEAKIDNILIMTVEPGLGGQPYIEKMNEKIAKAKAIFKDKSVEIDGGVNEATIEFGLKNGVDTFVIGNAITSKDNLCDEIEKYIMRLKEGK